VNETKFAMGRARILEHEDTRVRSEWAESLHYSACGRKVALILVSHQTKESSR